MANRDPEEFHEAIDHQGTQQVRSARNLKRRERVNDLSRSHNGTGVVRNIHVESCVHLVIRVIRGRIFYHSDLVAKLGCITNGRLDAGMRDKPDDDELMDAMLLKLQIQIRVGEPAGTPMLRRDDVAWLRLELGANLAAPRAVFESFAPPRCLLDGRNVFPGLIVAWTISAMQRIEDANLRLPSGGQKLQHVRNAMVGFSNGLDPIP